MGWYVDWRNAKTESESEMPMNQIQKLHAIIQQFEAMDAWGMATQLRLILENMKRRENESK